MHIRRLCNVRTVEVGCCSIRDHSEVSRHRHIVGIVGEGRLPRLGRQGWPLDQTFSFPSLPCIGRVVTTFSKSLLRLVLGFARLCRDPNAHKSTARQLLYPTRHCEESSLIVVFLSFVIALMEQSPISWVILPSSTYHARLTPCAGIDTTY